MSMTGVRIQQVPYRGTTQVLPDLLGGRLNIFFGNISNVLPLVREGKLRAFAITSRKRSPEIPSCRPWKSWAFPATSHRVVRNDGAGRVAAADRRQAPSRDDQGHGAARRPQKSWKAWACNWSATRRLSFFRS
jgi:hypothetical protein